MTGESITGGGRKPVKRSILKKIVLGVVTLGAIAGGGAGVHHRRELMRLGQQYISAPTKKTANTLIATYIHADKESMAVLPGKDREAMIEAGALKDRALGLAKGIAGNVKDNYQGRDRTEHRIKKELGSLIADILGSRSEMLRRGENHARKKKKAKRYLAEAEARAIKVARMIEGANPLRWPGEDREDARRQIQALQKLLASIAAEYAKMF